MASKSPPQMPASKFPTKLVRNQQPIMSDKNFFGANFETRESPIGERHSSAIVIIKYPAKSHKNDILFVNDKNPAKVIIRKANEIKNREKTNFSTEVGSLARALKWVQKFDIIGASIIIKSGLSD